MHIICQDIILIDITLFDNISIQSYGGIINAIIKSKQNTGTTR